MVVVLAIEPTTQTRGGKPGPPWQAGNVRRYRQWFKRPPLKSAARTKNMLGSWFWNTSSRSRCAHDRGLSSDYATAEGRL